MKRNLLFAVLGLLLMNGASFANKSHPVGLTKPTTNPVAWHATESNGGFSLQNETNKIQYVQVTLETGEIGIFTLSDHKRGKYLKELGGQSGSMAVVCELAPNDMLEADIDFAQVREATGTYQVLMDQ